MLIVQKEIENIVASLSPTKTNLLMVAEQSNIDILELIRQSNDKGIKIAGGIFPGILYGREHLEEGIILKELPGDSQVVTCTSLREQDIKRQLPNISPKNKSAIVLVDGLTSNIPLFLESLYTKYWNRLNYVGGGCGSLSLQSEPCLFSNEGFFKDAGMVIFVDEPSQTGVKHGWKKIAGPYIVNNTRSNVISEINWKPAFEVYKNAVDPYSDSPLGKDNFFEIAKGFPFGIYREGYEDVVRDPIMTEDCSSLTCVGEVSTNSSVNILSGEPASLIQCAKEAASIAVQGIEPSSVLVFDCISRVLFLKEDFFKELGAIDGTIQSKNKTLTLEGVLSLGEISSYGDGILEFFNKTVVVSTFH